MDDEVRDRKNVNGLFDLVGIKFSEDNVVVVVGWVVVVEVVVVGGLVVVEVVDVVDSVVVTVVVDAGELLVS